MMRTLPSLILVAWFMAGPLPAQEPGTPRKVGRGASDSDDTPVTRIIIPDQATAAEHHVANELIANIAIMTGRSLPVMTEAKADQNGDREQLLGHQVLQLPMPSASWVH